MDKVKHFLQQRIESDLENNLYPEGVVLRFPPEPNGFLHIGHAKSICLNFGLAQQYKGICRLRFDDTNPERENTQFANAICEDVKWLGFSWEGSTRYASDYFEQLYTWAVQLIRQGDAYVCDLTADQAREYRGTLTEPGKESPCRNRSVEENLDLLARMRNGEFAAGEKVLRAKIDMSSPNLNMRDPIMYRILKVEHHQTKNTWCIYPTYDFTHGQSDAIEGVSHSLCTLEFEDHRPLYEWFLQRLAIVKQPRQYEFARLNLSYSVTSKRLLRRLIDEGAVECWDDPRLPTISGLRRRGFTPAALRKFCELIGVSRSDSLVDISMLEYAIRDDLDKHATRAMCVLDPVLCVIDDYPEDSVEMLSAAAHPQQDMGVRELPFTREFVIDRADFMMEANKKYKRLVMGQGVRLRNAYIVFAESVDYDTEGNISCIHCSYAKDSLGEKYTGDRKVRGVIHWVSKSHGAKATVKIYDRLFTVAEPDRDERDLLTLINPDALCIKENCYIEPSLLKAEPEQRFQFEREGYFVADRYDFRPDKPVFNKIVGLRDSWAKLQAQADT